MADQGRTESFIAALTGLGGSAGNGRLREALRWDGATYSDSRDDPNDVWSGRRLYPLFCGVESAGKSAQNRP
jgi:hypothetical protein